MSSTGGVLMLVMVFVALGLVGGALLYSAGSAKITPVVNFGDNYVMTEGTQQNTTIKLVREVVNTGDGILLAGLILVGAMVTVSAIALATKKI